MEKFECKKCGKKKSKKAFSNHAGCKLGIDVSACKACKKAAYDWKQQPLEKRILNRIRARAKKKELDFNLDLSDIIIPDICPILYKPFIYGDPDWTYSVDRVDNDLGYIKGNIQIISNRANRLKGDFSIEELELILKYLRR